MSYLIVHLTLAVPQMILGEVALSFLGLGLRPPAVSLGTLLIDAQNIQTVTISPWLLVPGGLVILIVVAFSFLGDGLRDAVDPYRQLTMRRRPPRPRRRAAARGAKPQGRALARSRATSPRPTTSASAIAPGPHARARRRVRLRQDHDGAVDPADRAAQRPDQRPHPAALPRPRPPSTSSRWPASSRELLAIRGGEVGDDLPGADDLLLAGPHHRQPDHGDDPPAPHPRPGRGPRDRRRDARPRRHPRRPRHPDRSTRTTSPAACASAR